MQFDRVHVRDGLAPPEQFHSPPYTTFTFTWTSLFGGRHGDSNSGPQRQRRHSRHAKAHRTCQHSHPRGSTVAANSCLTSITDAHQISSLEINALAPLAAKSAGKLAWQSRPNCMIASQRAGPPGGFPAGRSTGPAVCPAIARGPGRGQRCRGTITIFHCPVNAALPSSIRAMLRVSPIPA